VQPRNRTNQDVCHWSYDEKNCYENRMEQQHLEKTQDSDTVASETRFILAKRKSLMGKWESRNG
jgi:flagellar motility protein MotE (MotC chaperone)